MHSSIATPSAPDAIGPYSQAVRAGAMLYCSGQLGLDPATAALVDGGVQAQTRRALENLAAVLEAGGSSLGLVVKTTVYLLDLADFERMNAVYAEFFPENPPARTTFQVAALPKAGRVEIDAIARCEI